MLLLIFFTITFQCKYRLTKKDFTYQKTNDDYKFEDGFLEKRAILNRTYSKSQIKRIHITRHACTASFLPFHWKERDVLFRAENKRYFIGHLSTIQMGKRFFLSVIYFFTGSNYIFCHAPFLASIFDVDVFFIEKTTAFSIHERWYVFCLL